MFVAHGIGLIKLDADNPAESQVLIPARERDEIDWDMVNRLTTENSNFLEYVKLVKQFYQTGEAREGAGIFRRLRINGLFQMADHVETLVAVLKRATAHVSRGSWPARSTSA